MPSALPSQSRKGRVLCVKGHRPRGPTGRCFMTLQVSAAALGGGTAGELPSFYSSPKRQWPGSCRNAGAGTTAWAIWARRGTLAPMPRPGARACYAAQHFLYFLPLPQGHGSLRPILGSTSRGTGVAARRSWAYFASCCARRRAMPAASGWKGE